MKAKQTALNEIPVSRVEVAELWEEIERLRGEQKKTFVARISSSLNNTFKSPFSTILSVGFAAPVFYKGFISNDTSLMTLAAGLVGNGMITNETPPPSTNLNPTM
jgi:hypothetical protein